MISPNRRRLILRLTRFSHAIQALEAAHAEAADLDAGFDAGEFSGPAHARAFVREADAIARRLGFASAAAVATIAEALSTPRAS